jgi:hypothetical protein
MSMCDEWYQQEVYNTTIGQRRTKVRKIRLPMVRKILVSRLAHEYGLSGLVKLRFYGPGDECGVPKYIARRIATDNI